MKRRYAVFAVVFAVSILMVIQAVEVADANPVPWPYKPNQESPILAIETPQNHSNYKYNVDVNFSVTIPESWDAHYHPLTPSEIHYIGELDSIQVNLDGNLIKRYQYNDLNQDRYILPLNDTSTGSHSLNITLLSFTYAKGEKFDNTAIDTNGISNGLHVYKYPNIVTDIVYFTVEQQQPSPSIMPSSTTTADLSTYSVPILAIASVIVIIAVASTVLVYFRRRVSIEKDVRQKTESFNIKQILKSFKHSQNK